MVFKGSLPNISTVRVEQTLQRSLSDSGVKYSSEWPSNGQSRPAAGDVPLRCCEGRVHNVSKESVSGSVVLSEILPEPGTHQSGDAAVVAKHPGVTVNKMQEWMLKGRMLSSEMKERIGGSSLRASARVSVSRNAPAGAQQQSGMDADGWRTGLKILSFISHQTSDATLSSVWVSFDRWRVFLLITNVISRNMFGRSVCRWTSHTNTLTDSFSSCLLSW